MLKKILPWILAVVLLFLPVTAQAAKEYVAESFNVELSINPGGSMQVTETITFRFIGGPFTYAYRDLDKNRTDGITFTSATLDGNPLPVNSENALEWIEVRDGNPLRVTWHFTPTTDTTRVFQITYQVAGVVRKNTTDDIIWMAIPPEHEYRVQASRIIVTYPTGADIVEQPQLAGSTGYQVESSGNPATITSGPVEADTPLVITLHFSRGSIISNAPAWQITEAAQAERTSQTVPFLFGGIIIFFMGMMVPLIIITFRQNPSDAQSPPASAARPVSPPTNYKPAVAAAITARGNPSLMHSLAALIDLAQRGILRIEQMPGKWYKPNIFELVRLPDTQTLTLHEQVLMDTLFVRHGQPVERVGMDQYTTLISRHIGEFAKAVKIEIGVLGLIDPERKKKQTRLLIIGGGLLLGGLILGIGLAGISLGKPETLTLIMSRLINALVGGCIAAFIGGLVYIIYAAFYSPLTSEGRWIASQWIGFSSYLRDIIRRREEPTRPDTFFQYLPFAAGFGFGSQWAKVFQKRGFKEVPAWFQALNAQNDIESFGAFTTFMTSSDTSASAGGGGAGGASGGGGSGAG